MKLKSFGCSFVYGSDLNDCPHGVDKLNPPPSNLTWSALLANKLALEYQCFARPAAGNLQILETLLSSIEHNDSNLYLINWTWIERFSFVSDTAKSGAHPWNPLGWRSIMPSDQDPITDAYYRYIHSQFRDKLETLVCMKTAIDVLEQENIKFLMTYTDKLVFECQWHVSPSIVRLQDSVRPYLCDFQGLSFWDWVQQNGYAISDKWHPLEHAHAAAAELMMPAIESILHKA